MMKQHILFCAIPDSLASPRRITRHSLEEKSRAYVLLVKDVHMGTYGRIYSLNSAQGQ